MKRLIIPILIVLFGCQSGAAPDVEKTSKERAVKPNILRVETVFIETSKGIQKDGSSVIIEFEIYFDKSDLSDIASVIIEDPEGIIWSFSKNELENKINSDSAMIYLDTLTSAYHKHYIPLGEYKLKINYNSFDSVIYKSTPYGRGDVDLSSGKIYSEVGDGDPVILKNATNYSAKMIGDFLSIEFKSNDELINNGYIWIYNEDSNCIGVEGWFSNIKAVDSTGYNSYAFNVSNIKDEIVYVEMVLYSDTTYVNDKTKYWCRTGAFKVERDN